MAFLVASMLGALGGPALAQSVVTDPLGTVYRDSFALGRHFVPLGDGERELVAREIATSSGDGSRVPVPRVYLAQTRNGRVTRAVSAFTNLEPMGGGWARDTSVCGRTDVHFAAFDRNYDPKNSECRVVSHFSLALGANPRKSDADFHSWATTRQRPSTALVDVFRLVKQFDLVHVIYFWNPEAEGFPPANENWAQNAWHKNAIGNDAARLAYIEKVKLEGDRLWPLFKAGFDGPLPTSTARPVAAVTPPTAPPPASVAAVAPAAAPPPSTRANVAAALRDGALAWTTFDGRIAYDQRGLWRVAVDKKGDTLNWSISNQGYPLACQPSRIAENGDFSPAKCNGIVAGIELSLFLSGSLAAVRGTTETIGQLNIANPFPPFDRKDIVEARLGS